MRTEDMVNRMKELEKKVTELARELSKRRGYIVQECVPLKDFIRGYIKETKIVQNKYGWSLAITSTPHIVVREYEVIEHEHVTRYIPLYKDYEGLYDGKVIDEFNRHKLYILILRRRGGSEITRMSLGEVDVDTKDYTFLYEEYHKSVTELEELSKETGIKYNILSTCVLY